MKLVKKIIDEAKYINYLLRKYIYKYPFLFGICILAFISVFLIQFSLSKVNEIWKYGFEFGKIIYDLSIGYLISYIFFFLVVFQKNENDKKQINRRIAISSTMIITDGYEIFCMLIANNPKFNRKSFTFPPTIEVLTEICSNTDSYKPPSQTNNTRDWHWFVHLRHRKQYMLEDLNKIFQLLPYLDSELVGIITNIEDSRYFYTLDNLIVPQIKPSEFVNFEFITNDLFTYFNLIKKLEVYCIRNILDFENQMRIIKQRISIHSFSKNMVTNY